MNLQTFLILYSISVPVFFLIDMLWLGVIASSFYRNRLGEMMQINWTAAIIFYFVFLMGLTFFAIYPAINENDSIRYALLYGALFGFFTYATYDMTNLATLKDWPLDMAIVDMIWGTVLGASVAAVTAFTYLTFIQ